jgi:hypothetical protein
VRLGILPCWGDVGVDHEVEAAISEKEILWQTEWRIIGLRGWKRWRAGTKIFCGMMLNLFLLAFSSILFGGICAIVLSIFYDIGPDSERFILYIFAIPFGLVFGPGFALVHYKESRATLRKIANEP